MATQFFAQWSQVGQPEQLLLAPDGYVLANDSSMINITEHFPNLDFDKKIFLKSDGNVYDVDDNLLFYSGLTIVNGFVQNLSETPTPTQKHSALASLDTEYKRVQIVRFINGVTFDWPLNGDNFDRFLQILSIASASKNKLAYILFTDINNVIYKCPDLPLEVMQEIQLLIDIPISKYNFSKKNVIAKLISTASTVDELNAAVNKMSEFIEPITININNICDAILADSLSSQSVKDYLNNKKDENGSYHLFEVAS